MYRTGTVHTTIHEYFAAWNGAMPATKRCIHAVLAMMPCMTGCHDIPHPVLYGYIVPVIIRM